MNRKTGRGLFITGTDTGVGKTVVAAAIALGLESLGQGPVCVMKPIETGCRLRQGRLIPADIRFHQRMLGTSEPEERLGPVRMRLPVAPLTAAQIEGRDLKKKEWWPAYSRLIREYAFVLVEGAGGVMVPVREDYLISDMICELGIPCVVVARTSLGTVNHTLLTVEHLRAKRVPVAGLVFNRTGTGTKVGVAERTGPQLASGLARVPILGVIPRFPSLTRRALLKTGRRISENLLAGLGVKR